MALQSQNPARFLSFAQVFAIAGQLPTVTFKILISNFLEIDFTGSARVFGYTVYKGFLIDELLIRYIAA